MPRRPARDEPAEEALERRLARLAPLADPVRRALYALAVRRPQGTTRKSAATALGLSVGLAAFHLDKLVAAGLLETTSRRPAGRAGPGAGRPAKLYRRARRPVGVSVPERRHDLLVRVLAESLAGARGLGYATVRRGARRVGERLGAGAGAAQPAAPRRRLATVLRRLGFAPVLEPSGNVRPAECPFAPLAGEYPAIICDLHLALAEGLLAGLALRGYRAAAERRREGCCVCYVCVPPRRPVAGR